MTTPPIDADPARGLVVNRETRKKNPRNVLCTLYIVYVILKELAQLSEANWRKTPGRGNMPRNLSVLKEQKAAPYITGRSRPTRHVLIECGNRYAKNAKKKNASSTTGARNERGIIAQGKKTNQGEKRTTKSKGRKKEPGTTVCPVCICFFFSPFSE